MTERLYYLDSHRRSFSAVVLACTERKGLWAVELDQTAFFPEGGGQKGDVGTLNGIPVTDTREENGHILHLTAQPLGVGESVEGELDWDVRFARMQSHSGEHIVSGLAHSLWGCENVGFHMAEETVTLDFDRELSAEQVRELERLANEAVWRNVPIRTGFPSPEELQAMEYRQKKPLSGDIRIVEVEGIDRCACCAPHVERTGEIGSIALTDAMRHRGGIRLTLLAGRNAYAHARELRAVTAELSHLFSAPAAGLVPAAQRVLGELEKKTFVLEGLEREQMAKKADAAPITEGCLLFIEPGEHSVSALRELANAGAEKAGLLCGVFWGEEGQWKYILVSRHVDLRANGKEINAAIGGRGGGSREMLQGSCTASRESIETFFGAYHG